MNRDQLADWLHCLHGGMYDWVADEIRKELAKPNQFYPDWDTLQPYHERIKELEAQFAQPEANLFWDANNPEDGYDSIEELISSYDAGQTLKILRAKVLKPITIKITQDGDEDFEYEIIEETK